MGARTPREPEKREHRQQDSVPANLEESQPSLDQSLVSLWLTDERIRSQKCRAS